MKILIGLVLAALLSGCVPIGVRGSSMPFRGSTDDPPSARLHVASDTASKASDASSFMT